MSEALTTQSAPAADPETAVPSLGRRLLKDPLGVGALGFLLLVVLAAVFAGVIAPYGWNDQVLADALQGPSSTHPLGTDGAGRDVLSFLLYGGRFSLASAALAVVVAVGLGAVSGLIAGYFGRWFDSLGSWAANILLALPAMIVLLAARSVVGPSAWWAMGIFGVILSASVFRLVRAAVQGVRNELYVDAARVSGLSDVRIIFRHVLRVVRAPIIIQVASIASVAIAVQAGLEFIGMGDPEIPSWGKALNNGFTKIYQQPMLVLWPGLLIALTCLALTLIANALRDALENTGATQPKAPGHAGTPGATQSSVEDVPLLEVHGLRIAYGVPGGVKEVVHGIDLDVRAGEVLGLIGESGSGKTQTAFGIMGLLPVGGGITGGRVLWHGEDLVSKPAKELAALRGNKIAYIPQEPMSNLDPSFTIGYQLVEPLRQHLRMSRAQARERARELLARVGIPDPARTMRSYPHEVSGGMAQRVLIAGAISCEPELLIADEPTTALDVTVQADILELLRSLQQDLQMGVILVTHNFGVVADLCDRVAVMQEGLIVERGDIREVFADPQHPYTRQLFDAILSEDDVRPAYVAREMAR
ncbi:dipeptide/oligopeptide/nickel ABC transporter permease/ATP-binding protein [Actinotalea sp. M2MS4P-6]|uniref:dipeptide/oligopeptide/nickel ABC transporter permease/ATP-binding protein n=1 Tax=Actinotalea sp. M2MS4P-6 TaxID=2983762 RepID=UPI0021E4C14A|nr:dipeptide/oligopeptide/nickel ABC transporter permease/ATP-binding protein [Actinotalea sp. M2MS4P-6]MCV2394449.1 dipeptide/oligopeptide/nickel ABC transporter permease/ATP-binding protein [Actinotalea sp. M2MS4P-6]